MALVPTMPVVVFVASMGVVRGVTSAPSIGAVSGRVVLVVMFVLVMLHVLFLQLHDTPGGYLHYTNTG